MTENDTSEASTNGVSEAEPRRLMCIGASDHFRIERLGNKTYRTTRFAWLRCSRATMFEGYDVRGNGFARSIFIQGAPFGSELIFVCIFFEFFQSVNFTNGRIFATNNILSHST